MSHDRFLQSLQNQKELFENELAAISKAPELYLPVSNVSIKTTLSQGICSSRFM